MPKQPENIPNFKPMMDRVLVRSMEDPESEIAIPDKDRAKPQRGVVLCKGEGAHDASGQLVPMTCVVGDMVYFGKYAGTVIVLEGEDFLNMREEEILGIIPQLPDDHHQDG